MKITEFNRELTDLVLTENEYYNPLTDEIKTLLLRYCRNSLRFYKQVNSGLPVYKWKFFYRGATRQYTGYMDKYSSGNRLPRDTSVHDHNMIVSLLNQIGFVANRNNSIFVTSNALEYVEYGGFQHIVFPTDGINFTWSPHVKDLYEILEYGVSQEKLHITSDELHDLFFDPNKFQAKFQYKDTDLNSAFRSGNEVMMAGPVVQIFLYHEDSIELIANWINGLDI